MRAFLQDVLNVADADNVLVTQKFDEAAEGNGADFPTCPVPIGIAEKLRSDAEG
jgi:hypothetical protein